MFPNECASNAWLFVGEGSRKILLEYLTPEERAQQRRIVLGLIARPPATMHDLIDDFVGEVG